MPFIIEKSWTTEAGLEALCLIITREDGSKRHRCGYVKVTPEHPAYGKEYGDELDCISQEEADSTTLGDKSPMLLLCAAVSDEDGNNRVRKSIDVIINCHGGVTFSGELKDQSGWWIGFDCAHYLDAEIEPNTHWPELNFNDPEAVIRSLEFVVSQCESMASQLIKLKKVEINNS